MNCLLSTLSTEDLVNEIQRLQVRKEKLTEIIALRAEVSSLEYSPTDHLDDQAKLANLISIVAVDFKLTPEELMIRVRTEQLASARFIVFYLAIKHCVMSASAIGRLTNRDHVTILFGHQRCIERMSIDPQYRSKVERLEVAYLASLAKQPEV
jgi:chromosomal replication initiation ATPase DnaA